MGTERKKSRLTARFAAWESGWREAWLIKRGPLGRCGQIDNKFRLSFRYLWDTQDAVSEDRSGLEIKAHGSSVCR